MTPDTGASNAQVQPAPTPFITAADIHAAGSDDPLQIGQHKLNQLWFNMSNTDADIDAIAAQAKSIRATYQAWANFKNDLALRKKRYLGFVSVTSSLDLAQAAAAMHTSPAAIAALMNGSAAQENARIAELQHMWDTGVLPSTPVLSASDKAVILGAS
jgi:hypothetical protein